MAMHWIWWIAAALAVGAEMLTLTYYLLAVGIALACGGIAAWLGTTVETQFLVAGVLGVVLVVLAHRLRLKRLQPPPTPGLDIGQVVTVRTWKPDGTARVTYRGTQWDAELASPDVARDATLYIVATRGSILVLSDRRPAI
jgi:membrane protein implicated in regulation of membrane protease activity